MKTITAILPVFLAFTACLNSPLLNHADADQAGENPPQGQPDTQKEPEANPPDPRECALFLQTENLCASITWGKKPKAREKWGNFTLKFWNKDSGTEADGPFVNPSAPIAIQFWMPSHGHDSWPPEISSALDVNQQPVPGVFEVTKIYFVMGGAWDIRIQLLQMENGEEKVGDQAVGHTEIVRQ